MPHSTGEKIVPRSGYRSSLSQEGREVRAGYRTSLSQEGRVYRTSLSQEGFEIDR